MPLSACNDRFGPACYTCNTVGCDELDAAVIRAIRTCGKNGGLTGARGAVAVAALLGVPLEAVGSVTELGIPRPRLRVIPGGLP